ncbi:hypothetical protein AYO21_00569 [Fonsecaea monophora]|uniref:Mid2 domain-containing protein n=1 Tax=Fonsecaea monophora TaxID=254056 RepID=A0A177FN47_9EURO|nr:hypothetical protein AYO21_00569 [Fonsecaea monophora]OAG45221.1 hypothetical protein AYO21_00569 [Fonsecaea monophora]
MLFLLFLALIVGAAAQDQENIFLNPPTNGVNNDFTQNPTYVQGSTITLQWETTYPSTDLVIWQNGNPNSQLLAAGITTTKLSWTVGAGAIPPFDLSDGSVFFFQMYNSSTSTFFSSHYFNVSDPSLASTTSTGPSSTTTPPPSTSTRAPSSSGSNSSTTSRVTPTPTVSPESSNDGSSSSSSNNDNKLGIGLGIGIGVCAFLILVAGLVWYICRRRRRQQEAKGPLLPKAVEAPSSETASVYPTAMSYGHPPSEHRRYELGSTAMDRTQAELDGSGSGSGGSTKAV